MRKTKPDSDTVRLDFEHYGEMVDFATDAPLLTRAESSRSPEDRYSIDFYMSPNFEKAREMALNGWAEGGKRTRDLTADLFKSIATHIAKPEFLYDVTGECGLDMGRFNEGDPECFLDQRDSEDEVIEGAGNRVIHIVVNSGVSACISGASIAARGAAIAALVDCLEYADHRVELTILSVTKAHDHDRLIVVCPVKKASDVLDPEKVSFVVGHPSQHRRINWGVRERADLAISKRLCDGGGYGISSNPKDDEKHLRGDLYFGAGYAEDVDWETPAKARAWVIAEMRKQGVTITEPGA